MFFFLSKILNFALNPLLWVFVLFFCSLIFKKRSKLFLSVGLVSFLLFSSPLLSNYIVSKWEIPATPKENLPLIDVGIVLTGALQHIPELEEQFHFTDAADRVTEAMVLYKQGLISKILITGGSGAIMDQEFKESETLKSFLLLNNFPEEDIIIEPMSRNTHENALFTAEILEGMGMKDRRHLLITSAFHMRRSLSCFSKEQIDVIPYSVDFRSTSTTWDIRWVLPGIDPFTNWRLVLKECVGMVAYKVAGYI